MTGPEGPPGEHDLRRPACAAALSTSAKLCPECGRPAAPRAHERLGPRDPR
jgi:hypothetical protein